MRLPKEKPYFKYHNRKQNITLVKLMNLIFSRISVQNETPVNDTYSNRALSRNATIDIAAYAGCIAHRQQIFNTHMILSKFVCIYLCLFLYVSAYVRRSSKNSRIFICLFTALWGCLFVINQPFWCMSFNLFGGRHLQKDQLTEFIRKQTNLASAGTVIFGA